MDRRSLITLVGLAALARPDAMALAQATAGRQGGGRQGGGRQGGAAPVDQGPPIKSTPPGARDRFIGMYRLISMGGAARVGRIYYDRAGRMGAMLHPPDRKPLPTAPATPSADDYREMVRGLVAYYGTYDVDPATNRVAHHIEAASNPAWIGTDFVRWYSFEENRLILRTSPNSTAPLIWERLPDA